MPIALTPALYAARQAVQIVAAINAQTALVRDMLTNGIPARDAIVRDGKTLREATPAVTAAQLCDALGDSLPEVAAFAGQA